MKKKFVVSLVMIFISCLTLFFAGCDFLSGSTASDTKCVHNYVDNYTCHTRVCTLCGEVENATTEHTYIDCECACGVIEISEGLNYELSMCKTYYTVTGPGSFDGDKIGIPSEYNGLPVKKIDGDSWFYTSFIKASIPDSIVEITKPLISVYETSLQYNEEGGLWYLGNETNKYLYLVGSLRDITSATINPNCKVIGYGAFFGCAWLTDLTVPSGITTIGNYAFTCCLNLNCNVDGDLMYLASESNDYAYLISNSSNPEVPTSYYDLTTATLNPNCEVISDYAFYYCDELTTFNIDSDSKLKIIGDNAFFSCKSLTEINIPKSVTSIGEMAFCDCTALTSINFEEDCQLSNLGDFAFAQSGVTSITLGNNLESISGGAFLGCKNLTDLTISERVYTIHMGAFANCENLERVYYTGTIDDWVQINFDAYYANPLYYAEELYINNELVTTANITTATKINDYAFYEYDGLTSITIGDSVESIGDYVFYWCSSLRNVIIGESVTWIGVGAFAGCNIYEMKFNDTTNWYYTNGFDTSVSEEAIDVSDEYQICDILTEENSRVYYKK